MSDDARSSSEGTRTHDEAIAAGNAAAGEDIFDSDDDDVEVEEVPSERRSKRKRLVPGAATPTGTRGNRPAQRPELRHPPHQARLKPQYPAPDHPPPQQLPKPPSYSSSWLWSPGQWIPQAPALQPQWGGAPQTSLHATPEKWPSDSHGDDLTAAGEMSVDGVRGAPRRLKRAVREQAKSERDRSGQKPNRISVTTGGEIDAGCAGKNAWDLSVRTYVPRILDLSIVDWEKQSHQSVQKLREALDNDFEYVGHDLGMLGFRNAIKRYLKMERSRLKNHFLQMGEEDIPPHVNPDQWERLLVYWATDKQVKKAATMAHARRNVKSCSLVARKGRAGREAELGEGRQASPGTAGVAQGMQIFEGQGSRVMDLTPRDSARILAIEKSQADLKGEFSKVLAAAAATSIAVKELKCMLSSYLGKSKDDGSPSVSRSTLENALPVSTVHVQATKVVPKSDSGFRVSVDDVVDEQDHSLQISAEDGAANLQSGLNSASPASEEEPLATVPDGVASTDKPLNPPHVHARALGGADIVVADAPTETVETINIRCIEEEEPNGSAEADIALEGGVAGTNANPEACEVDPEGHEMDDADPYSLTAARDPLPKQTEHAAEVGAPSTHLSPKTWRRSKSTAEKKMGTKERRLKQVGNQQKRGDALASKFGMGDEVFVMNPRFPKQKVAVGNISGIGGRDMFHCLCIPGTWFKLDVKEALRPNLPLMFEKRDAEQRVIKDVVGGNTIWDQKYLKKRS